MARISKSNNKIINKSQDYLDGLLLSDGNISIDKRNISNKTAFYQQECKHVEWLNKIKDDFFKWDIESKINSGMIRTGGLNKMKKPQSFKPEGYLIYRIYTPYYIELLNIYKRWYNKWYDIDNYPKSRWNIDEEGVYYINKKIVPKNIRLTPECVLNWYLGDGYLHKQPEIILNTSGFTTKEIVFLGETLSEILDINCNIDKQKRIFISSKSYVSTFLDYISYLNIPYCYSYKFKNNFNKGE